VSGDRDGVPVFAVTSRPVSPGVVLVEVCGELDLATAPEARAYLDTCLHARPEHLVLDLSGVTFMASHGVNLLVGVAHDTSDIDAGLHLIGVRGNLHVERLLDITGLTKAFDIHPELSDVLGHLGEY
jgi:anti-sigma B factor antagonist